VATVAGDFQETTGARHGHRLTRGHSLVEGADGAKAGVTQTHRPVVGGLIQELIVKVADGIAEAVHVNDLTLKPVRPRAHFRPWQLAVALLLEAKAIARNSPAQMRGHRRKHVPSVE